jgi:hypothetical protein
MDGNDEPDRTTLDEARLWSGGIATAAVTGLIAAAGVLILYGLFGVTVIVPGRDRHWHDAAVLGYAGAAALASLGATGLMDLLVRFTPRPMRFFSWIVGLATTVTVAAPFASGARFADMLCTALLNLVLGVATGTLVVGTARSAARAESHAAVRY